MILLVALYGTLALIRELCVVRYFGSIATGLAWSASGLGSAIEAIDFLAIFIVFEKIISGWRSKVFIPWGVYVIGGAIGTYIGVKRRK